MPDDLYSTLRQIRPERFDLATKLGTGQWISQGSYSSLDDAKARAEAWLDRAGPSGVAVVRDSIGAERWHSS